MAAPSFCQSCGYIGGRWVSEGKQKLPAKDRNGNFIFDDNGRPIWRIVELWTCPQCGSTAAMET